ncbi:piggyBac transposable element-derived protein 3-like [Acipenser ruthenus]|uniref:piggyBac transposable element-derived protein 3-like n=1 Tax=Acipenser ruthenus TaxID=7906 RepID=UPI0027424C04|nr:piggyBac transposable element-derived protein 3-like [Acipenser ruthenus]
MVEQTNLYAIQSDPNRLLNDTNEEMEQFIGICFYMSVYGLPQSRMFWCTSTRVDCVAYTMGTHCWETIKRFLHFANNDDQVPAGQPGHDRLLKVRPLLTSLLKSFKATPMDEMLCVDEQIAPFKGKSAMKQYNPKKPKRWGYKLFLLSDSNGIIYNFDIYTGSISPVDGMPDIGASGNVVLRLVSIISDNLSYKIFFDNWLCSIDLQVALQKQKIHSVGTVRQNCLAGCTFMNDKEMKKGRGTFEEKETKHNGVYLRAVKWFNNRPVTLLSTYAAANPTSTVERQEEKGSCSSDSASIVKLYNQSGVDLLDSLIALY